MENIYNITNTSNKNDFKKYPITKPVKPIPDFQQNVLISGNCCKIMEKSWQNHGKIIAKPWQLEKANNLIYFHSWGLNKWVSSSKMMNYGKVWICWRSVSTYSNTKEESQSLSKLTREGAKNPIKAAAK